MRKIQEKIEELKHVEELMKLDGFIRTVTLERITEFWTVNWNDTIDSYEERSYAKNNLEDEVHAIIEKSILDWMVKEEISGLIFDSEEQACSQRYLMDCIEEAVATYVKNAYHEHVESVKKELEVRSESGSETTDDLDMMATFFKTKSRDNFDGSNQDIFRPTVPTHGKKGEN